MIYRGYEITRVPYHIQYFPPTTSVAVINPNKLAILVANEEVGKHVIDVHVDRGDWENRDNSDARTDGREGAEHGKAD